MNGAAGDGGFPAGRSAWHRSTRPSPKGHQQPSGLDGPRTPCEAMVTGLYPSSSLWRPHHTAGGHRQNRGGVPTAGETSHSVVRAFIGRAWVCLPSLTQTLTPEGNLIKGRSSPIP